MSESKPDAGFPPMLSDLWSELKLQEIFFRLFPFCDMGLFPGSRVLCLDGGSLWLLRCELCIYFCWDIRGPSNWFGVSWPNAEVWESCFSHLMGASGRHVLHVFTSPESNFPNSLLFTLVSAGFLEGLFLHCFVTKIQAQQDPILSKSARPSKYVVINTIWSYFLFSISQGE